MKNKLFTLITSLALTGSFCFSQTSPSEIKEDFKPSTLNQPGKEYPMVNSQGYARFRIEAPNSQSVTVSLGTRGRGGTKLTRGADSIWVGTTEGPMDEGFHYYHLTIADQPHRAMAGLSMGGMETKTITLNKPEVFSHYALLSGGTYTPADIKDKSKVKLIFLSCGSKERPDGVKYAAVALKEAGFNAVSYVSEGTAHEFLTWRRSLYQLAPLLFKN